MSTVQLLDDVLPQFNLHKFTLKPQNLHRNHVSFAGVVLFHARMKHVRISRCSATNVHVWGVCNAAVSLNVPFRFDFIFFHLVALLGLPHEFSYVVYLSQFLSLRMCVCICDLNSVCYSTPFTMIYR